MEIAQIKIGRSDGFDIVPDQLLSFHSGSIVGVSLAKSEIGRVGVEGPADLGRHQIRRCTVDCICSMDVSGSNSDSNATEPVSREPTPLQERTDAAAGAVGDGESRSFFPTSTIAPRVGVIRKLSPVGTLKSRSGCLQNVATWGRFRPRKAGSTTILLSVVLH